jgi:hypothetical protein
MDIDGARPAPILPMSLLLDTELDCTPVGISIILLELIVALPPIDVIVDNGRGDGWPLSTVDRPSTTALLVGPRLRRLESECGISDAATALVPLGSAVGISEAADSWDDWYGTCGCDICVWPCVCVPAAAAGGAVAAAVVCVVEREVVDAVAAVATGTGAVIDVDATCCRDCAGVLLVCTLESPPVVRVVPCDKVGVPCETLGGMGAA